MQELTQVYWQYEEMKRKGIKLVDIIHSLKSKRNYYMFNSTDDSFIGVYKYVSRTAITQSYRFVIEVKNLDGEKVKVIKWRPRWWQTLGLVMSFRVVTEDMKELSDDDLLNLLQKFHLAEGYYFVDVKKFHKNTEVEIYDTRRLNTFPIYPIISQGNLEVFAVDSNEFQPFPSTKKYSSTAFRLFNHIIVPFWWNNEVEKQVSVYEFHLRNYVSKVITIDESDLTQIEIYSSDHGKITINIDEVKQKYNIANLLLIFAHAMIGSSD